MNLKEEYRSKIAPALKEKFGYKSIMQAPKLEKIVINMGVSDIKFKSFRKCYERFRNNCWSKTNCY